MLFTYLGHIDDLFDEIPKDLLAKTLGEVPAGLNEMQITRLMHERAAQDGAPVVVAEGADGARFGELTTRIENGEIAYPVNECTVAGNLRDMLRTIVPANDARTHLSHVVPSLLVEGLTLAGA